MPKTGEKTRKLAERVKRLGGGVKKMMSGAGTKLAGCAKSVVGFFRTAFGGAKKAVSGAGAKLAGCAKSVGGFFRTAFGGAKKTVSGAGTKLAGCAKSVGGFFRNTFGGVKKAVPGMMTKLAGGEKNPVQGGIKVQKNHALPIASAVGVVLALTLCVAPPMPAIPAQSAHNGQVTTGALEAVTVDASFLSSSGTVLVHTDGRVDDAYLRQNLISEPPQPFGVSRVTDNFFAVRFESPPQKSFELKLRDVNLSLYYKNFAIEHTPPEIGLRLKLVSESELDRVDVSAPLLLMLSGDVTAQELESKLEFSEPADIGVVCNGSIAVITPKSPLRYDQRYKLTVKEGLTTASGEKMRNSYYNEFSTRFSGVDSEEFKKEEGPFAQANQELTVEFMQDNNAENETGTVTMIFSDKIEESILRSSITLSPPMEYSLQCKSNVAVLALKLNGGEFVPAAGEKISDVLTNYRLTVEAGMLSVNGQRLNNDREEMVVLSSESSGGKLNLTLTNQSSNAIDASKPIMLEFLLENSAASNQLLELEVYNVNSYEQYKKLLLADKIKQDFGLARVASAAQVIHEGLNKVELANPGKGTYLIMARVTDAQSGKAVNIYKCINVTDLSVYLQTADSQSVIWINSTVTKQPAAGIAATILSDTGRSVLAEGTTDAQGFAVLKYKDDEDAVWKMAIKEKKLMELRDAAGNLLYADITTVPSESGKYEPRDLYYSMLYSDRSLYHPTDTISIWGFVKPYILNKEAIPQKVRLTLDKDGINQFADVDLLPSGAFSGEIKIDKMVSSGYSLQAELLFPSGETRNISDLWLNVKEFEKPTFVLSTKADRELFAAGEDITASAELKSYDGTPFPQYPLELTVFDLYDGNVQETRKLKTDASGKVSFSFRPDTGAGNVNEGGPVELYYMITLANDGEVVQKRGSYYLQSSEVLADADFKIEGGRNFSLTVNTAKADVSLISTAKQLSDLLNGNNDERHYYENEGYYYYRDDKRIFRMLAGAPLGVGVKAEATVHYVSAKGERKTESREFSVITRDGAGSYEWQFEDDCDPETVYVRTRLTYVDDRLNQSHFWFSLGDERNIPQETEPALPKGYTMSVTRQGEGMPLKPEENYMGHNEFEVKAGDALSFKLMRDGAPAQNNGRIFWMLVQNREFFHSLSEGQSIELTIRPEHAQSTMMCAAYFDGVDIYPILDTMMRIDMKSVNLNVSVQPDKTEYFPGDAVNLAVHVADEKGAPVKSSVCVSVVDESIFALSEQYVDVVESLYGELSFGGAWVTKYTTTIGDEQREPIFRDGGKGGGDNLEAYDIIRENFKDTALFLPTVTDGQGNASISFELPDNTTSWRITTLSVGDNLYGGQGKDNLISTMPFYSKPVITSKYIEGDEVTVLMQGHGKALSEDADIYYLLNITGNGIDKTIEANGKAYSPVLANLGKLSAGEYTVSATSRYNQMSDTVKLPLTVISSNLEMLVSREINPADISQINALRFPVTVAIIDKDHMPFYKSVSRLFTHYCDRADQRLSRYVAKRSLAKYYDKADIPRHIAESGDSLYYLQKDDGGIAWYYWEENSDPVLTAKTVLAVGADKFSVPRMTKYLEEIIAGGYNGVTRAMAYAALASIKPETTLEINRILIKGGLQMEEKLYYIAGLAAGGDKELASEIYQRDVAPFVVKSNSGKQMIYSKNPGEDDRLTAAAWVAASKIGLPDAESFSIYFANDGWGISTIFECMIYISGYNRLVPSAAPIAYTVNGVSDTISLGVVGQKTMTFSSGEFSSLKFGAVSKNITMMAYYVGEPEDADMKVSPNFTVQKTMTDEGEKGIRNTISIRFKAGAPKGRYDISDFVPSNMRFFSRVKPKSGLQQPDVYMRQELQKLYFSFDWSSGSDNFKIEYYTRRAFEAKTTQDRVYMIHADTGETAFAERRPAS